MEPQCHTSGSSARADSAVRLVEVHEGFSSDLKKILESEGYQVITFGSVEEMLHSDIDDSHPGCVVLAVQTLGPGGLDLRDLLTSKSTLPVILVTANTTAREVVRAMKQGAADLFCNPLEAGALVSAVNKAVTEHRCKTEHRERRATLQLRQASLSPRERQVFELMILGDSSKTICDRLGLAQRTLKHYRSRVMEKMGVKTVVQLVLAIESSRPQKHSPVDDGAAGIAPKDNVHSLSACG